MSGFYSIYHKVDNFLEILGEIGTSLMKVMHQFGLMIEYTTKKL